MRILALVVLTLIGLLAACSTAPTQTTDNPPQKNSPSQLVAPGNLVATATENRIDLHWTDNNSLEEGFRIFRKLEAEAKFPAEATASVSADTTTYSDTDVVAGSSYVYQIVAFAGGNVSQASNTSAPAMPTAPANPTPGLTLVTGFDTSAPTLGKPRPTLNQTFTDERYGTTITRVSDVSQITDRDKPSWVRHEYSRKQAFNADSSKVILNSSNGWMRLYQVNSDNSLTFLKTLSIGEPQEPTWHPSDPNLIYMFNYYGEGMKIYSYDIRTDKSVVLRDFSAQVKTIFGNTASSAWTKQEGRPSDNGNIWCLQVRTASDTALGLIAYDFANNQILGHLKTTDQPDHISTSPQGNYCVPSWPSWVGDYGTRAYTTNFQSFTQLHTTSEHSDLAVTASGAEVYVYTDYEAGDVAMKDLATGTRTSLFPLYGTNNSGTALHISGTAKNKPGYVVVSTYACFTNYGSGSCDYTQQWFNNKVVAVQLEANPTIFNLAHIHNGDAGYFSEPQATVNPDLTKILYTSSWESDNQTDVHDYLISLPSGTF
jgi:hypothetical protein